MSELYYWTSITSSVLAFSVILIYYINKRRQPRNAVDAFNYLTTKVVENEVECEEVIYEILRKCNDYKAVGFDCEWVTECGKRNPVALIQISTFDGYCVLFRLNKLKCVPKSLKSLLEEETIYKVGVAPIDDAKYLANDYGVFIKSTLDVRHIVQLCGHEPGGLAALSLSLLGVILDKTWRIRCSDWDADELTIRQTNYAAADAHAAIKILHKLINRYFKKDWLNSRKFDIEDIWKYADICFRTKTVKKVKNGLKYKENSKDIVSKRYPYVTRSKPLYHNCFLQAPDGELLCTCDVKKAEWYVEKHLADIVKIEPLTVKLRFEPAGRSVGDVGKYYQLSKENHCVVCGEQNSYIRKNVVPREYRKYFPELMKDHSSHDVLLLCVVCHQRSNSIDRNVREKLAIVCDAPFADRDKAKYREDADCKKIRSAARALLYQSRKHNLPEKRRKELEEILLQHFPGHDEITEELLSRAAEISIVVENSDYECHGYKVTEYYLLRNGLLRLEELWREHFLETMKPRFMPELWSIKHNEERLRVRFSEGRLTDEEIKLIGVGRDLFCTKEQI